MTQNVRPVGAPVVDFFDHNARDYVTDRFRWFTRIRDESGPIVWSSVGGHWLVIGAEEVGQALRDWETFSSSHVLAADGTTLPIDGIRYEGMFVPPRAMKAPMIEADPPEWTIQRQALAPHFTPAAVGRWRQRIQDLVDACIDRRIETGSIDFAHDLSNIVPAVFSLELTGVSTDRYEMTANLYHVASHLASDDPMWADLAGDAATQGQMVAEALEAKKSSRGSDLISALLNARDRGTEFSDAQIVDLAGFIIAAGIDTTGSLLASTFAFLTERPDIRARLIENPKLTVGAFEEFTRIFAPTQSLCRTVTKDTILGGQSLRRGDRVMLCYAAACRDPAEFDKPDEFVLERKPNLHLAFGGGNHRCLGSLFARLEFEIVTNTVLRRMPDFQVDLDSVCSFDHVGVVTGFEQGAGDIHSRYKAGCRSGDSGMGG